MRVPPITATRLSSLVMVVSDFSFWPTLGRPVWFVSWPTLGRPVWALGSGGFGGFLFFLGFEVERPAAEGGEAGAEDHAGVDEIG